MKRLAWLAVSACAVLVMPALVQAQPNRQIPGTRPHLPGSPPATFPEANSRTRAAQSGVGLESTDFYGKKGYPRILGDSVETSTNSGSSASGTSGAAAGLGGGALGGGSTGGGSLGGGALGGGNLGFRAGNGGNNPTIPQTGITGGGFSGLVPKGFGFGGTPDLDHSWLSPMRGGVTR